MCLYPKVIVNPEFYRKRHLFPMLHSPAGFYPQQKVRGCNYYWPQPYVNGTFVDPNDIDEYYGVHTDTGEIVPTYVTVPCGKCVECAIAKQNDWRSRMIIEQSCHPTCPAFFLTLTYDDAHLPSGGVYKPDVTAFFKRLHDFFRHHNLPSFRSVAFSEYGSLHGRPHYHSVIFGFNTDEVLAVRKRVGFGKYITRYYRGNYYIMRYAVRHCWRNGFTYTVNIRDDKAFGYISKYVAKNLVLPSIPDGCRPDFSVGSRMPAIGGLFEFNENSLSTYPKISVNCLGHIHEITMPTYLRRKLTGVREMFLKAKHVRLVKDVSINFIRLFDKILGSPFTASKRMRQYYADCMFALFNGFDLRSNSSFCDLFNHCFKRFELFLPLEYTDFHYAEHLRNSYNGKYKLHPEKYHLPFDTCKLLPLCKMLNELLHKVCSIRIDYDRYQNYLRKKSHYNALMLKHVEHLEALHPKLYESAILELQLISKFKYQYRIKDEQ